MLLFAYSKSQPTLGRLSLHMSQMAYQAGAYPEFFSMKGPGLGCSKGDSMVCFVNTYLLDSDLSAG